MAVPAPLAPLYAWLEYRGLYVDTPAGTRVGFLYPPDALQASRTAAGGTAIEFMAEGTPTCTTGVALSRKK